MSLCIATALYWVLCCLCLGVETTTQVNGAMTTVGRWNYTMTRELKEQKLQPHNVECTWTRYPNGTPVVLTNTKIYYISRALLWSL